MESLKLSPLEQLKRLKQKKLELLFQKENYKKIHSLEFFKPMSYQKPLFDAVEDPKIRVIIALGGNRSGKSCCGGAIIGNIVEGHAWGKQLTKFKKRPLRIRVLGEDYEKAIGQVLVPYVLKFVRPELIASKRKNQLGVVGNILLTDGTTIDFLTYAQGSDSMEGWEGDVVWYDEPPPRTIFIANQRGLIDRRGIAILTMTPLKEPWISQELCNVVDDTIFTHIMETKQNETLDLKAIQAFEDMLSDEEKETRLKGKFLHLQGLIFKEFDKKTHVIKPFEIPRNYTVYVAIDTHPRTQQALIFMAVDPKTRFFVVHEIFNHGTPEQIADWIIKFHIEIHPVCMAIIEPGSKGDQNRGDSTYQVIERLLAEENIPLECGSRDMDGGILQMREAFKSANGMASLFIFDRCVQFIFELQNYVWKDWAGSTDKNEMQKPRDKDDHLIECVRRLIQHPVEYQDGNWKNNLLAEANAGYVSPTSNINSYGEGPQTIDGKIYI